MHDAELYQESNVIQRRDARQCLDDYAKEIKWKNDGATVIDIGCGEGSVTTSILKPILPDNYKELVGCDISENMIEYANAHHARDSTSFTVLDIAGKLPDQFREKFDHAFSFYALQWTRKHQIAFSNIHNLLARDGDCLLMFVGYIPVYDIYMELTRLPRWRHAQDAVQDFLSLYYDCQDPEEPVKKMMTEVGFTNVRARCLDKEYVFYNEELFTKAMLAVSPFEVPLDVREDFYKDLMKVAVSLKLVNYGNNDLDDQFTATLNYKTIIVYGQK